MTVFKQGNVYRYEFEFLGQRVRESAHTSNLELARSIERNRRRAMEESAGGVKPVKPVLFRRASKAWLGLNPQWSASTLEINTVKLRHLLPIFGKFLLTEITPERIAHFQTKRLGDGVFQPRSEHGNGRLAHDLTQASPVAPHPTRFPPTG